MGFFLIDGLKALGGFFKNVFGGLVGVFVEDFHQTAAGIVEAMFTRGISGAEKLNRAQDLLILYAATEGKAFINHASRLLIETEVFKSKAGDDWRALMEKVTDMGLEEARQAVMRVDETAHIGDDERRDAAARALKFDLRNTGKEWVTDTVKITESWVMNWLIEGVVAEKQAAAEGLIK